MEGMVSTGVVVAVLVLLCGVGVRSYLKKLRSGCCGGGSDPVKRLPPKDRDTSHYSYVHLVGIQGMHCQNCARRIENAFHQQEGFYAKVNFAKGQALVRSKEPVSEEDLKQVVRSLGYTPTEVKPVQQ